MRTRLLAPTPLLDTQLNILELPAFHISSAYYSYYPARPLKLIWEDKDYYVDAQYISSSSSSSSSSREQGGAGGRSRGEKQGGAGRSS
jgi:hypothetical protein